MLNNQMVSRGISPLSTSTTDPISGDQTNWTLPTFAQTWVWLEIVYQSWMNMKTDESLVDPFPNM